MDTIGALAAATVTDGMAAGALVAEATMVCGAVGATDTVEGGDAASDEEVGDVESGDDTSDCGTGVEPRVGDVTAADNAGATSACADEGEEATAAAAVGPLSRAVAAAVDATASASGDEPATVTAVGCSARAVRPVVAAPGTAPSTTGMAGEIQPVDGNGATPAMGAEPRLMSLVARAGTSATVVGGNSDETTAYAPDAGTALDEAKGATAASEGVAAPSVGATDSGGVYTNEAPATERSDGAAAWTSCRSAHVT